LVTMIMTTTITITINQTTTHSITTN